MKDGNGITAEQYIEGLGLDFGKWLVNGEHDQDDMITALLLVRGQDAFGGQFSIVIGQGFDCSWMEPDDLGWMGPVRGVLMYKPIAL